MNLILLGPPGAGKGTLVTFISRDHGIPGISTGNILRAAIKAGTPVGEIAQKYISKGNLVPDDVIIDIVRERLTQPDCEKGFIFDGFPRTIPQAEALEQAGVPIDAALLLDVTDEIIVARMVGRRTCLDCGATYHVKSRPPKVEDVCDVCGSGLTRRKDDAPETVRERLRIYHRETEPLVEFYRTRGLLYKVNGAMIAEKTYKEVAKILEGLK